MFETLFFSDHCNRSIFLNQVLSRDEVRVVVVQSHARTISACTSNHQNIPNLRYCHRPRSYLKLVRVRRVRFLLKLYNLQCLWVPTLAASTNNNILSFFPVRRPVWWFQNSPIRIKIKRMFWSIKHRSSVYLHSSI